MFVENKKNAYIAMAILAIIIFVLLRCSSSKKTKHMSTKDVAVSVVAVRSSKMSTPLEAIGTAVSNESADITSSISHIVTEVNFSDCDVVKKGQLLIQLKSGKRLAEQKQAEINLAEQQREHDRLFALKSKKVIPEKDYDMQNTKFQNAKAKMDEINAEIKENSITAPFDGILGIRKVSVGALVTPGSVITTIDDISKIKVDFSIPEKYIHLIKQSDMATLRCSAVPGKKFIGHIIAISPRVSVTSRNVSARCLIDNKDYLLRPGMTMKITIPMKERETIQIPERAVASIGEKHYVFTAIPSKDSSYVVAKIRYITTGERKDGFVEINDGLEVGEMVIADGIGKLSDGVRVKIRSLPERTMSEVR